MGTAFSFLARVVATATVSGLSINCVLPPTLPRHIRVGLTVIGAFGSLTFYIRSWIQDYYFDRYYRENILTDLTGRTAVITGATVGGIGYAAAELLYRRGADVILTVRSIEKGEIAVAKLKNSRARSSSSLPHASFLLCDFLSEESIRKCAKEIMAQTTSAGIDFLILNAGISGQQTSAKANNNNRAAHMNKFDEVAMSKIWMTNHLGPFLFSKELMPCVIRAAAIKEPKFYSSPRVVWVSSGAHKKSCINWNSPFCSPSGSLLTSYGQSKLANIMHMREYQKRVNVAIENKVICTAVTPGAVWTNMIPPSLFLYPLFWAILRQPETGAQVIKMACLDRELKGGEYLSNCYVKATEGVDGCSNDDEQWEKLWELSSNQIRHKEYSKIIAAAAAADSDATDSNSKKTS